MPYALCPMPYALCPMPYALCPKNPERFSFGDRFAEIAKLEIFSNSTIIILYAPTQKPLIQGIDSKIF